MCVQWCLADALIYEEREEEVEEEVKAGRTLEIGVGSRLVDKVLGLRARCMDNRLPGMSPCRKKG
ncbi:MAG: hypothetical protein MZV70_65385 [Desulfobacterales bacterium]|nr:hypothetical protein [Desulfobacterales bacterium]